MRHHVRAARVRGFSLIELLVVVGIIAILAAFALPAYTRHVGRTHRTAAEACMAEYANYMERYYTSNLRYDKAPDGSDNADPHLDCQSQVARNYAVTQATTASGFTITATPTEAQQARDRVCGTLTLNQRGARAASGDTGGTAGCW